MSLGKDVGMLLDACVIEVGSSKVANVIHNVVQKVEFLAAQATEVVGARLESADWSMERS